MIIFIKDIIKTAFLSLWSRKLRTFLSILGIVIGILTVSALLTVALSVRNEITKSIGTLGANFIAIVPGDIEGGNFTSAVGASTLTEEDFNLIKSNFPELQDLAMASMVAGNIKGNGQEIKSSIILGGSPGITEDLGLKLGRGRLPDQDDENTKSKVAVLGSKIAEKIFGGSDPLGQTILVRNKPFTIIGVLSESSFGATNISSGPDFNSVVLMPLQTSWDISNSKQIFRIAMHVPDPDTVKDYKSKLEQLVLQNHGGEKDFSVFTQDDILNVVNKILDLITSLLSAIAAISLVVGGIGIMNTMLVSVSERTREIGIRKSVGATRGDILFQFLLESIILTLMGGIFAVVVFSSIIFIAGSKSPIPLELDWRVMGGAILFSAIVGIVFGVFPAYKASIKDPIVALRYE